MALAYGSRGPPPGVTVPQTLFVTGAFGGMRMTKLIGVVRFLTAARPDQGEELTAVARNRVVPVGR